MAERTRTPRHIDDHVLWMVMTGCPADGPAEAAPARRRPLPAIETKETT